MALASSGGRAKLADPPAAFYESARTRSRLGSTLIQQVHMLSFFRRGTSSKIMLVVLGIGLLAIVITGFGTGGSGVGGIGGGATGDALVEVGDQRVTAAELTDQVNRQLARVREQQPELDMGTFFRGGAFEEILRQLIGSKAMLAFGEEQGIAASKRMIDGEIASIPAFQNLAGQFDDGAFRRALQAQQVSEQQLREELASSLIQRQILLPVAGSARVPQSLALQYASLLLEQRTGSVGLVPAQVMATGPAPTDAEVAAFYRANEARYTIPERRVLRYATFGRDQVLAATQPTEAEVQAAYRAQAARYGAKETRTLSQVVLPDEAAARAFAAKLAGGTSFDQAAQQAGFGANDVKVGQQSREQFTNLTSTAVANAAWGVGRGAVIPPTQSPLGWHVVRVDDITSTGATPLAAVRAELERQIQQQKQEDAVGTLVARVEDALGGGASFEEVARAEKLQVQETPPVTATGQQPGVAGAQLSPDLAPLLKPAFDMSPDEDPVVETIVPGQRFAIMGVSRVVPAAAPPLAQIAQQVRRDLTARRAGDRARALATSLVAKINAGTPARAAFAAAGVPLPALQSVTARRIEIARPNQPVPPPLAMMFSLPKGRAKILAAPNGAGWFVVHMESSVAGDASKNPQLVEATRTQFQRIMGEEYAAQFTRAVEGRLKVERNAAALARLRADLLRGGTVAQ